MSLMLYSKITQCIVVQNRDVSERILMKKINKAAIAQATANTLAKHRKRKSNNSYVTPNYRVDVHISSSNTQRNYNTKKRGK